MQPSSYRASSLMEPDFSYPEEGGARRLLPSGQASVPAASNNTPIPVTVDGELDFDAGDQVRDRLDEALAASARGVELDLSGLGFCDCAGLSVLLELRHRALGQGKTVTIRASNPAVDRLLDLVGARELFSAQHSGGAEPCRPMAATLPSPKSAPLPGVGAQRSRLVSLGASGSA
ncbi:STAS domain-containing protein [Streptomyces sp. NPDC014940]|uniref:STAS domain-containing protein n=1 Tax=Streptomyces sp. NPDC014940 TaxID=3364932 RepID=UPI0036FEA8C3